MTCLSLHRPIFFSKRKPIILLTCNLHVSGWGEWSLGDCSLSCGSGTQDKTRTCLDYNGDQVEYSECPGGEGASTTTGSCEAQDCPRRFKTKVIMICN